jgi:membrane protein YdbS with pleckstrin-like domain
MKQITSSVIFLMIAIFFIISNIFCLVAYFADPSKYTFAQCYFAAAIGTFVGIIVQLFYEIFLAPRFHKSKHWFVKFLRRASILVCILIIDLILHRFSLLSYLFFLLLNITYCIKSSRGYVFIDM